MAKRLGIYIHIPFCASKCAYCDFYSVAGRDKLIPRFHSALIEHIKESSAQLQDYLVDTVYFGGGTPSYYGAHRLSEIFDALKIYTLVYKAAEVTCECNPDSMTRRELKTLFAAGFNRLSIGAQSANADLLKMIGRRHSWKQVELAMKNARSCGFKNISLDLMYGLPSQSGKDWAETLSRAIELGPEHLSCYGLKLEEGTPLYSYHDSPLLPNDDEQADMYLYMVETLEHFGYKQYEISNFSKEGFQSRHNMKYWRLKDYMGYGPGAHSCVGDLRFSYVRNVREYISGLRTEDTIVDEVEKIGLMDRASEYLMLGLRTVRGISEKEYYRLYRSDFAPLEEQLEEYRSQGLAVCEGERWHLTPSGFLVSNVLIGQLLERQSAYRASASPWMSPEERAEAETRRNAAFSISREMLSAFS